jgi:hypothetical protein
MKMWLGAALCTCWAILVAWAYLRRERPVVSTWPDEPVQPWDERTVTLARPVWGYGGGLN